MTWDARGSQSVARDQRHRQQGLIHPLLHDLLLSFVFVFFLFIVFVVDVADEIDMREDKKETKLSHIVCITD